MMAHEFALMRRLLKEHSGLNLGSDKQDMLEGKLGRCCASSASRRYRISCS